MHRFILILALLTNSISWAKPAATIDDTNDLTAKTWLVADANNKILASKDLFKFIIRKTK